MHLSTVVSIPMSNRIPKKPETFIFEGIPNQRVSDVWHMIDGAYSLNWLRTALRNGCKTRAELKDYRERVTDARLKLMWERRDAYWAARRAEAKTAGG